MKTYIVIGLGYGDEGKGSWVDHLVRKHDVRYTIRFNGGAQALHHVVSPEGVEHGFSQFGSGTLVDGVITILSRFMLVEPLAMIQEAKILSDKGVHAPFSRMIISQSAPLITPYHIALNRCRERQRGNDKHGSCGFGIGETQKDHDENVDQAIVMGDILDLSQLQEKLAYVSQCKRDSLKHEDTQLYALYRKELALFDQGEYIQTLRLFRDQVRIVNDRLINRLINANDTIFEGAQGALLDQSYGFFPHVTRSNTTFSNAEFLLETAHYEGEIEKIGLLRAYGTRHGAGPFITEDSSLHVAPCHNTTGDWQGNFRTGWFDAVAARYALSVVGDVDVLAITNVDRLFSQGDLRIVHQYNNADERFFSESEIYQLPVDYSLLAERTETMNSIIPMYKDMKGFSSVEQKNFSHYKRMIEDTIGRRVDAISTESTQNKCYL